MSEIWAALISPWSGMFWLGFACGWVSFFIGFNVGGGRR